MNVAQPFTANILSAASMETGGSEEDDRFAEINHPSMLTGIGVKKMYVIEIRTNMVTIKHFREELN